MSHFRRILVTTFAAGILLVTTGCDRFLRDAILDGVAEAVAGATTDVISAVSPFGNVDEDDE